MIVKKDEFPNFDNCKFKRKEIAVKIIEPLLNYSLQMNNITINGPYGYGKTTFLKMLSDYLVTQGYEVIFFNAWETDFISDPFLAIYTEIITDKINDDDNKKFIKNIIKSTVFGSAKIITQMLPPGINAIAGAGVDAIKELVDLETTEIVNEYRELKNDIIEFRSFLAKKVNEKSDKPLIFIIDELDRCKPTYSIALLERVKHLFNIDGIKFVFGIDKKQLSYAVSSLYGNGMDSEGYLRRFFDIEYSLPKPDYKVLLNEKFNNKEFDGFLDDENFMKFLNEILSKFDFSVRDFEKMSLRLSLINYKQYDEKFTTRDTIVTRLLLVVFKMKNEEIYEKIENRIIKSDLIRNEIDIFPYEDFSSPFINEFMYFMRGYLDYAYKDPNNHANGKDVKHPNYENRALNIHSCRMEVHDTIKNILNSIELTGSINE